jgi:hypothetical protein
MWERKLSTAPSQAAASILKTKFIAHYFKTMDGTTIHVRFL